jgi:hypothetical protein
MATHQIAKGIAQLGRNGDSMLMHVQPEEVAGLQALAKSQGTSLTINPETGLPEAFNLGGFFRSLLPTIAGFAAAGMSGGAMSPMVAGILAGAGTGALTNKKDPLMGAVMGGLGGYGGQSLYGAAMAPTAAAAKSTEAMIKNAGVDPSLLYSGSAVKPSAGIDFSNVAGQGVKLNPAGSTSNYLGAADDVIANSMRTGAANQGAGMYNFGVAPVGDVGVKAGTANLGMGASGSVGADNLSQAVGNITRDPLGFIGQNKMAVGMPLGMAALSGLEPSDIYGEPMKPDNRGAYDPYSRLNLSGDTGLRLYAQGGPVSFADGGDTGKDPAGLPGGGLGALAGGESSAMQGSGLLPLDVSDINAKYGVDSAGVPVPRLGLFADNDQIEAARTAYERQLASAMSGRGGMGSPFGFGGMNRGMAGQPYMVRGMGGMEQPSMTRGMAPNSSPMAAMTRTMGGTGIGATAPTASTAETALSRLNLNKQYAAGGTIQSGGLQDLYGSSDNVTGPALSRDGYGLGRLQAMANGGVAGYAKGGYLDGPGTGLSDSIPATIEGKQPARLADGEFVVSADVVSALGEGSSKAGSQRLYKMMDRIRQKAHGKKKQINRVPESILPA